MGLLARKTATGTIEEVVAAESGAGANTDGAVFASKEIDVLPEIGAPSAGEAPLDLPRGRAKSDPAQVTSKKGARKSVRRTVY